MLEGPDHPTRADPTISTTAKVALVVVFAVGAVLAILLFFTGVVAGGGDDSAARCSNKPIAASVAPDLDSFHLVSTTLQEPEGCGADYKRHLIYEGRSSDADPLRTFEETIKDEGWASTACVTSSERCFERGDWFLAATVPGSGRQVGYPQPIGTAPQVLAVLQRR